MLLMNLEQAIVYVISMTWRGMTTAQIANEINEQQLYIRNDGLPVSSQQVYAVICRYPHIFTREGGLFYLIM